MVQKNRLSFILLLFVLFMVTGIKAQNPIVIQSVLTPPYPVYYSDIEKMPELVTIIVQNTDMNNSYTLRFKIKMDGRNGVTLLLNQDVIPANPVTLGPGEVKTLNGDDLSYIYHGIGINDLTIIGIDPNKALQSQRIPDGSYSFCVQAFDNTTIKPLSGDEPTGCSNKMFITTLEPPVIQLPANESEIQASNPQQIIFRWTPVQSSTSAMLYDIRIAEVPEGISPYEAMRTDNLLFFEETDYPATIFSYGPSFPTLMGGKTYALQIRAHGANDDANIRNDGKSEIVIFNYRHANKTMGPIFSCGGNCPPLRPPSNTTPIDNLEAGNVISVANFEITLTEVNKVGDRFTGQGLLSTSSFFAFPLWMEFENIGVNTNYEVFTGKINAMRRDEMTQMDCYSSIHGFEPASDEDMDDIYDLILNPLSAITVQFGSSGAHAGLALPVGYGEEDQNIAITRLQLTPTRSEANLIGGYTMAGDFQNGEATFVFGLKNVCITPGGPTSGEHTKINLLRDVDYFPNANYTIRFKAGRINDDNACWGNINCDGLQSVNLAGIIAFDQSMVKPVDQDGNVIPDKSLAASFHLLTDDPDDWIALLDFTGTTTLPDAVFSDRMQIVGYDDYSFSLGHTIIDNSIRGNHRAVRFPASYHSGNPATWQGIFFQTFNAELPNYFNEEDSIPIEVSGTNFIYDDWGYTFKISSDDVLTEDQPGKLDGMDYTMEHLSLDVVKSELVEGTMEGKIKLEIASNFIDYDAAISVVNKHTRYHFNVETGRPVDIDMWGVVMNLDPTSTIEIEIVNDDVDATTRLTGQINLNDTVDGIAGMELHGISFENLELYSHAPYIGNAHFNLVGSGIPSFGGIDVEVDNIALQEVSGSFGRGILSKKALGFDLTMNLGGNTGFAADCHVDIIGKKTRRSKNWSFDDINVGDISLNGEVSTVSVDGVINWYKNDEAYGNGFRGSVAASFFDQYTLQTEMLFGTKDDMEYWYVDGIATFPVVTPIAGSIGLKGFGGGAFYNMLPRGTYRPMQVGVANRNPNYVPDKQGWGFKALAILATEGDESKLNGVTQIEMDFHGSTISKIGFNGQYAMMREPAYGPNATNDRPMIYLEGTIDFCDRPGRKYLDADFGYDINIPKNPRLLWGSALNRSIAFHDAGWNDWYLYLGKPGDMIELNLGFDYDIFGKNINLSENSKSYFCIGSDLPAPPSFPPPGAPQELRDINVTDGAADASGVMMGTHINWDIPEKTAFSVWGNGIKFRAGAGLGFDMGLRKVNGALCNGSDDFGINHWRADARGYLYGYAHLKGEIMYKDFNIAGGSFTAGMQTIMPNPTYFGAGISMKVDLPIYGDYTIRTSFSTGETCEYTMDESFTQNLALEDILEGFELSNLVDSVYAYDKSIHAAARLNIPYGSIRTYTMADNEVLKTKVGFEVELYEQISDEEALLVSSYPLVYSTYTNDRRKIKLASSNGAKEIRVFFYDGYRNSVLEPNKDYKVKIKTKLMYAFGNDAFRVLLDANDKPAQESKIIRFSTKKARNERIENVVSAVPALDERFFYMGDYTQDDALHLTYSNDSVFNAYGHRTRVKVVFEDVYDGATYFSSATLNRGTKTITYSIPRTSTTQIDARTGRTYQVEGGGAALKNGRIYEVRFYIGAHSERDLGNLKEIYSYYCRTSIYNSFIEKLQDLEVSSISYANKNNPTTKYAKLKFKLKEPFGIGEVDNSLIKYIDMFEAGTSERNQWASQRRIMEYYARATEIDLSMLTSEFQINTSRYRLLGPLQNRDINEARQNGYAHNKPINLQVDWKLNSYAHIVWVLTKLHQDQQNPDNQSDNSGNGIPQRMRRAMNISLLNNYDIDWSSYTYSRFAEYDVSNMRNSPYVSSPNSFDAIIKFNEHVDVKLEMRSSGYSGNPTGGNTGGGKPTGGNSGNGKPGRQSNNEGTGRTLNGGQSSPKPGK
jgi:hypothetical protein